MIYLIVYSSRMKTLLRAALTDRINDREVYMKGVDASYHYEGYDVFKTADIKGERPPKKILTSMMFSSFMANSD